MYSRIVLPLDGSAIAEQALDEAKELASRSGATLHLLRVVDPLLYRQSSLTGMFIEEEMIARAVSDEIEQARDYLTKISDEVGQTVPAIATDVIRGQPAAAIVSFCRPGDLLVMVTHGRGGLLRFFLGSIAEAVLRQSTVPTLLIRAHASGD